MFCQIFQENNSKIHKYLLLCFSSEKNGLSPLHWQSVFFDTLSRIDTFMIKSIIQSPDFFRCTSRYGPKRLRLLQEKSIMTVSGRVGKQALSVRRTGSCRRNEKSPGNRAGLRSVFRIPLLKFKRPYLLNFYS